MSILDDPNPLSIPSITIAPAQLNRGLLCCVKPKTSTIQKVGVSLQLMLRNEFGDTYEDEWLVHKAKKIMEEWSPQLAHYSPADALAVLKAQLKAYFNHEDPFNQKKNVWPRQHKNGGWILLTMKMWMFLQWVFPLCIVTNHVVISSTKHLQSRILLWCLFPWSRSMLYQLLHGSTVQNKVDKVLQLCPIIYRFDSLNGQIFRMYVFPVNLSCDI